MILILSGDNQNNRAWTGDVEVNQARERKATADDEFAKQLKVCEKYIHSKCRI